MTTDYKPIGRTLGQKLWLLLGIAITLACASMTVVNLMAGNGAMAALLVLCGGLSGFSVYMVAEETRYG